VSSGVLLDTHVLIWIVEGVPLRFGATEAIDAAALGHELIVSAVSAWEIGYLATRPQLARVLGKDVRAWFRNAVRRTHARIQSLEAETLLDVAGLPLPLHRDPADRMLIATARAHDLTLITRDRAILDYAALGHVRAIAC
jgi:PIN domain nuclease of toxin-antitoxin system